MTARMSARWVPCWWPFASCPGAQPHFSLTNGHIPVFPSLQDLENHVTLQLVKHLWDRTTDRLGPSPLFQVLGLSSD